MLDGRAVVPVEAGKSPVVPITTSKSEEDERPTDPGDRQSLLDALIRSMQWGNDERVLEFGERLGALWPGARGAGEDGILRYFADFEDVDRVIQWLPEDLPSARIEELENGSVLNKREVVLLADAVAERGFEADGENDAWDIAKIHSSTGVEAFVAQIISGCSWEGIESTFIGAFPTLAAAKQALAQVGYLDEDDFRRRFPSRHI